MSPELRTSSGAAPSGVVFADPHVTPDGTTVIEVTRVRRRRNGPDGVSALGIYAFHDGKAVWLPVVDTNRVALIGVATGFVAATLATLAVLKRPPWPTLTGTITAVHGPRR